MFSKKQGVSPSSDRLPGPFPVVESSDEYESPIWRGFMQDDVTYSGRFWLRFADNDELRLEMLDRMSLHKRGKRSHIWRPPTDVWETAEAYTILVEVAGMKGSEFSLTLQRDQLRIQGYRPEKTSPGAYQQMEIAYGEFLADVHLNNPVDPELIQAAYADGFLHITLPKAKPETISVHEQGREE